MKDLHKDVKVQSLLLDKIEEITEIKHLNEGDLIKAKGDPKGDYIIVLIEGDIVKNSDGGEEESKKMPTECILEEEFM